MTTLYAKFTEREKAIAGHALLGMYQSNNVPEGERDIYASQLDGAYGSFHDALERFLTAYVRNVLLSIPGMDDSTFHPLRATKTEWLVKRIMHEVSEQGIIAEGNRAIRALREIIGAEVFQFLEDSGHQVFRMKLSPEAAAVLED
jgi:hypothetical protein